MPLRIREKLSLVNFTDRNSVDRIHYFVVHYCGTVGSAEANVNYYYDTYRGASAPYVNGQLSWEGFLARLNQDRTKKAAVAAPAGGSPFAADAWARACAKGVFDGANPTAPLIREQAAVVLDRLDLLQ